MSLDKIHHEAWTSFFVAHGLLMKEIDVRLAEAGVVSMEVYDVLLTLEMAPDRRMRMSELADAVLISRSGLTRQIDRLEKEGWVERQSCPGDRRALHAALTAAGLAERERAWPVYRDAIAELFAKDIPDGEAKTIQGAFAKIVKRLRPSLAGPSCDGVEKD